MHYALGRSIFTRQFYIELISTYSYLQYNKFNGNGKADILQ